MSHPQRSYSGGDMKSQLRNFINLLQTDKQNSYLSLKSSGKLSVILSASQPQSSQVDKQNSRNSANKSIKNSQFQTACKTQIISIMSQLAKSGLDKHQQKLLKQLSWQIQQIIKKKQLFQGRSLIYQDHLAKQKKGTDQLLEALVKMKQEEEQLWKTYYQLTDKFNQKQKQVEKLKEQNNKLSHELEKLKNQQNNSKLMQDIEKYKKQLKFVKKLIYIANENYEQLQNKYMILQNKSNISSRNILKPNLVLRQKRSQNNLLTQRSGSNFSRHSNKHTYSPNQIAGKKKAISPDKYDLQSSCSPLRKSSISIKSRKSISPLRKDKQNIESNFKDVYRKMILKNINNKK